MYTLSVIINSESLTQLQHAIYAFMCILYSNTINTLVEKAFNYLKVNINQYEILNRKTKQINTSDSENMFFFYDSNFKFKLSQNKQNLKSDENKNNNLLRMNQSSLFYKMCEKIFEKCKLDIDNCELIEVSKISQINPRKSHELLFYFVYQFSATLCLWTKLSSTFNREYSTKLPLTLKSQVSF
jgi:hypothetical protein